MLSLAPSPSCSRPVVLLLATLGVGLAHAGCLDAQAAWTDSGVSMDAGPGGAKASTDTGASSAPHADSASPVRIVLDGATPEMDAETTDARTTPASDAKATPATDAKTMPEDAGKITGKDAATPGKDAATSRNDGGSGGRDGAGGVDVGTTTTGIPNCANATSAEQTAYASCSACDNASCGQYVAAAVVACSAYYACFAETSCATAVMSCAVDSNANCDTAATELATCQGTFCALDCSGV